MAGRLVGVPAGDERRRRAQRDERLGELGRRRVEPVSARASSRFGVTTVASGKSRATSTSTASSSSSRAPELATMTGSTTSGTRMLLEPVGDGLDDRAGEEHPRLRGVDPDVAGDRVELRAHEPRRHLVDGATPRACSAP